MKHFLFMLTMLLALPLCSTNSNYFNSSLSGTWVDRYENETIEIREYGSRIEVKKRGLFRKTKTFYRVGQNRFSDRDNDQIEIQSSSRLIWKNRRNRDYKSFVRVSYNNDRYRDRYDHYDDRRDNRRNDYDNRRYNDRRYNDQYNNNSRGSSGRFDGRWTCPAGRRNISIQSYSNGFKVQRWDDDRWYTFERDPYESNVYRCDNGERYIYKDDYMVWYGRNGCDNIRFRRR